MSTTTQARDAHDADIEEIVSMGYTATQAKEALNNTENVDDAIDYLFSRGRLGMHGGKKKETPTEVLTAERSAIEAPVARKLLVADEDKSTAFSTPAFSLLAIMDKEDKHGPKMLRTLGGNQSSKNEPLISRILVGSNQPQSLRRPPTGPRPEKTKAAAEQATAPNERTIRGDYLDHEEKQEIKQPSARTLDDTVKGNMMEKQDKNEVSAIFCVPTVRGKHPSVRVTDAQSVGNNGSTRALPKTSDQPMSKKEEYMDEVVPSDEVGGMSVPEKSTGQLDAHNGIHTETLNFETQRPCNVRPGAFAVHGSDVEDHLGLDVLTTSSTMPPSLVTPVTAVVVNPDEENQILEERLQRELQAERERAAVAEIVIEKKTWGWKRLTCLVGAILIAVVGVVLAVSLTRPQPTAIPGPTPAPTLAPLPHDIVELLSSVSFDQGASLRNDTSPQSEAARWLANNSLLDTYEDQQKIQRYVLATLYYSTKGEGWKGNGNWLSDLDECLWFGKEVEKVKPLECSDGALINLFLDNNNLAGTIPDEIGLLSNSMLSLRMMENRLEGHIPLTFKFLTNMKDLELRSNNITGPIPTTLGLLTRLENLFVQDNKLQGAIPTEISQWTSLRELWLNANNLVGPIPSTAIGSLTLLEKLRLDENNLTGIIPTTIALLSVLRYLEVHTNKLTGSIPNVMSQMPKLEQIDLNGNSLTGSIPTSFGKLTTLTDVFIHMNELTGQIPTSIALLTSLEKLFLNDNKLSGSIPTELGLMSSRIKKFRFFNNSLTGSIPTTIGLLTLMEELRLDNNSLTGEIPTEIALLTNLVEFNLAKNNLTGSIQSGTGRLSVLEILDLESNLLTGRVPSELGLLTILTDLMPWTKQPDWTHLEQRRSVSQPGKSDAQ